jgi:hypothetical protein
MCIGSSNCIHVMFGCLGLLYRALCKVSLLLWGMSWCLSRTLKEWVELHMGRSLLIYGLGNVTATFTIESGVGHMWCPTGPLWSPTAAGPAPRETEAPATQAAIWPHWAQSCGGTAWAATWRWLGPRNFCRLRFFFP